MKHESARSGADSEERDSEREEGFLGRWSRRKASARDGVSAPAPAEPPQRPPPPAPTDSAVPSAGPGVGPSRGPGPEAAPEAPLPDVHSLDENSDVSGFLSPEVSEELRRLALRRLFGMPKFNFRDGLDDYDEDYRTFESLGDVVTADMRHRLENEAKRAAQRVAEDADGPARPAEGGQPASMPEPSSAPAARAEADGDEESQENRES